MVCEDDRPPLHRAARVSCSRSAVSGFVLLTLGLEKITHALHGTGGRRRDRRVDVRPAFGRDRCLPSGPASCRRSRVVIVGEVARIRSWLYYMIGGGLALAALPLLGRINDAGVAAMPDAAVWQVLATAGFVGGLVYWIIAGRNA